MISLPETLQERDQIQMQKLLKEKIFCVGLGKTGTSTFARIMRNLGSNHITGPVHEGLIWRGLDRYDKLFEVTDDYDSFDDFPYPYFFERCFEKYKQSKFVLTTRSSDIKWLESLKKHHLRVGPTDAQLMAYGCYSPFANEDRLLELYNRHNEHVREFFDGSDRFIEICWNNGDDANRLSKFLGLGNEVIDIPVVNAASDVKPDDVIMRFIAQDRFGAAIEYAKDLNDGRDRLAFINDQFNDQLNERDTFSYKLSRRLKRKFNSTVDRLLGIRD